MRIVHALGAVVLAVVGCSSDEASPVQSPVDQTPDAGVGGAEAGADVGSGGARTDGPSAPDAEAGAAQVTFTPASIAADAADLVNPLRGQYRWLGVAPYPSGSVDNDSYQRWNWDDFEPTHGSYKWSLIDDELTAAKTRRGRFGMRIMPLCQGCGGHTYQGAQSSIPDDLAAVANPLIVAPPGETTLYVLPDWNSEAYLTRLAEMLGAIGARYKDDPTFAWVDVSSYGNWGEFHLWPFSQAGGPYDTSTQRPITDANARRIVQMNATAFPSKLLVVNSEQAAALTEAVATKSPPIGLRVDCLGSDGLAGGEDAILAATGAGSRWRTAPFITEWCQHNLGSSGANLFVQGAAQVKQFHVSMLSSGNFSSKPTTTAEIAAFRDANVSSGYRLRVTSLTVQTSAATPSTVGVTATWKNDNVAPTYLAWRVLLVLRGPTSVELPLSIDLRTVIDAPVDDAETLHPASLPPGSYQALLRVEDVQGISLPMYLAMEGRDADGNYLLGTVTVP
jgi:hypothetical protein